MTLDAIHVERFCDPLHIALRELGVPSVLIDRGSPQRRPSTTPTRWWTPLTQRAKLYGTLRATLFPDRRHTRLIHQIRHVAAGLGIPLPPLSSWRFNSMVNAVLSLASKLEARMRYECVRVVFVVSYYDVSGYAYLLAASRVGATSVDVQHGVTGDLNMAYAGWGVEPSEVLALLPRYFWCWTKEDALIVSRWANKHRNSAPRAFVGGHPFLEAWRTGALRLAPGDQQALNELVTGAEERVPILVTLQPHLTSEDSLAPLIDAWRLQPNIVWWIRLHPSTLDQQAIIEAFLVQQGVMHWNIRDATSLPLPALLQEAAMHATHSSSTVIEAELLGLSSVIWSEYGQQLFETQIRRGTAIPVFDGETFVRALPSRRHSVSRSSATAEPSRLPDALRAVLKTMS